jgi:hypothetical protein
MNFIFQSVSIPPSGVYRFWTEKVALRFICTGEV